MPQSIPTSTRPLRIASLLLLAAAAGCSHDAAQPPAPPHAPRPAGTAPVPRADDAGAVTVLQRDAVIKRDKNGFVVAVTFTGATVTDDSLRPLAGLVNLQRLTLAQCTQVTDAGVDNFSGCRKLRLLDLRGGTGISQAGIERLGSLVNLVSLRLSGPAVTDGAVAKFSSLTKMRHLVLQDASVSNAGLSVLAQMPELEYLDLSQCTRIDSDGLPALQSLTKLKELRLWMHVSDAGLARLAGLTTLERLNLDKTHVTDAGLAHLKSLVNLVSLRLNSNTITDAGLEHLAALTKLQELSVAYCTGVTEQGIAALKQSVPGLQQVKSPAESIEPQ